MNPDRFNMHFAKEPERNYIKAFKVQFSNIAWNLLREKTEISSFGRQDTQTFRAILQETALYLRF